MSPSPCRCLLLFALFSLATPAYADRVAPRRVGRLAQVTTYLRHNLSVPRGERLSFAEARDFAAHGKLPAPQLAHAVARADRMLVEASGYRAGQTWVFATNYGGGGHVGVNNLLLRAAELERQAQALADWAGFARRK